MKSNYFYCDIPYKENEEPLWLTKLFNYSTANKLRVYVVRFPVVDTKHEEYNCNFCILIPGHKIAIIQETDDEDVFEGYSEDVISAISYLYQKYDYRPKLGRFKHLESILIDDSYNVDCISDNLDEFLKNTNLSSPKERRLSFLFISLCIGSINEIDKVGTDVPQTLLEKVRHKIQLFDADQTRFIYDQSQTNKIVRIQGLSGTGKTELLLHKLKELYVSPEKYKIFFTCHNKILASTLHQRIEKFFDDMKVQQQLQWNSRLWCVNAWGRFSEINSGFYRYICGIYGIPFGSYGYAHSFEGVCKEALDFLNKIPDFQPRIDYMIVDESQDFGDNFIKLCDKVTKYKVIVAGDIFQTIFSDNLRKKYEADYFLSKCYRTAPNTLMFAHALGLGLFEQRRYRWLSHDNWLACGYKYEDNGDTISLSREPMCRFGEDDENYKSVVLGDTTEENLDASVQKILKELSDENNGEICPDDIAIIFLDESNNIYKQANMLQESIERNQVWRVNKAYETKQIPEGFLTISNRNNTKGLEFPYIICISSKLQDEYTYRNTIYTMLTRSFIKSYLLFTESGYVIPQAVINGLRQIEDEHRMVIVKPSDEEVKNIEVEFEKAQKAKSLKEFIGMFIKEHNYDIKRGERIENLLIERGFTDLSDEDLIREKIEQANEFLS